MQLVKKYLYCLQEYSIETAILITSYYSILYCLQEYVCCMLKKYIAEYTFELPNGTLGVGDQL